MRDVQLVFLAGSVLAAHLPAVKAQNRTNQSIPDAPLVRLTEFRHQHRKTIDGRLCAAAFVQDNKTYTDCTDARSPDGTAGKEWCYVEVQLLGKGPKDWNYCSPAINYDALRLETQKLFEVKVARAENVMTAFDAETARIDDMLSRFNANCGALHQATGQRVEKIENMLMRGQHCVKKLEEAFVKTGLLETTIAAVKEDIEKNRKSALLRKENCAVVQGYEDDPFPDGIRGAYYNNPYFETPVAAYRTDKALNMIFSGKGPIEGVSSTNFSVRWDGYVEAPESGTYTFSIESDCGSRVFLNEEPIIVDRMPPPADGDYLARNSIPLLSTAEKTGLAKTQSPPLELLGGEKYRLRVEVVHSTHLKFFNPNSATIRLFWTRGTSSEEVIPTQYYFTSDAKPPVKISGIDPRHFQLGFLNDGEPAFADSDKFILADVPLRYQGRLCIKSLAQPTVEEFLFNVNVPATIYVASLMDEPLPLAPLEEGAWRAHETEEILSVYFAVDEQNRALESRMLRIQYISLRDGGSLAFRVVYKDIPFLIFAEQRRESAFTCGGEEEVLSLVGGHSYANCDASSQESDNFNCEAALSGKHMDQPQGAWHTKAGNGVGETITVRFKTPVQITHFRFKPRDDLVTWPSQVMLSYSEEKSENPETFPIRFTTDLEENTYQLRRPVITNYVQVEITEMYVNGNDSGGSFEFVGSRCAVREKTAALQTTYPRVVVERCDATAESFPEISPLEEGEKFIIVCPWSCIESLEGPVYGDEFYAPTSALCAAGVHAGVCAGIAGEEEEQQPITMNGGVEVNGHEAAVGPTISGAKKRRCEFFMAVESGRSSFHGKVKFGVSSLSHGPAEASLGITAVPSSQAFYSNMLSGGPLQFDITFGDKSAVPEGWLRDDGAVSQSHDGLTYGWWRKASVAACGRRFNNNPLMTGGVAFPPPSEKCEDQDCSPNFWTFSFPENGLYRLQLQLTGPCDVASDAAPAAAASGIGAPLFLQANGVSLANGQLIFPGSTSFVATAQVPVTDKQLTLTSLCKDAACSAVTSPTVIMNLRIQMLQEKD